MELAKILPDGSIDLRWCDPQQGVKITELRNAGFLNFVASKQPTAKSGEIAVDSFAVINGKIVQSWSIQSNQAATQALIEELKQTLADSDYKVIKCYEASLTGETLPYDIEALHKERQAVRDEINRLESTLV